MRVIVLAAVTVLDCFAQQTPQVPHSPQQIARWFVVDAWNKGDLQLVSHMLTPSMILHYRGRSFPLTVDAAVNVVQAWRTAFPDFHFALEDMIVEGNKVALRIPFTGTQQGRFWGLEPSGRKISVT